MNCHPVFGCRDHSHPNMDSELTNILVESIVLTMVEDIKTEFNDEVDVLAAKDIQLDNKIDAAVQTFDITTGSLQDQITDLVPTRDAYTIAVDSGYEGTEAEWLASLKGDKGLKGDTGARGPIGPKGDDGLDGAIGKTGPKGDKGLTGDIGPKGDTGDKGATGNIGPMGPIGETGLRGLKGDKGDTGARGATGLTGPKGDTGARGLPGRDGEKGPQGSIGPMGFKGDAGESAYEVAVTNGFIGTKTEWLNYIEGASAYEIAVDNGFSGSKQQWLTSLKPTEGTLQALTNFMNNDAETDVTVPELGNIPSLQGYISTMFENGGLPATPFINKTRMESSSLPDDSYAIVTDSVVLENNGYWRKESGQWIYLKWNPLEQVKDLIALKSVGNELVDFNDYLDEGDYALTSPSAMQTALNSPFVAAEISESAGRWSVLKVYKLSTSVLIQVFYGGGESGLITSRYASGFAPNITWTEWQKPILEKNIKNYNGINVGADKYIPDGTDILEFVSDNEGFFAIKSNSSAETMLNCPTNLSSRIEVSKFVGDVATVRQITIWDNKGNIWTRAKGGGLWQKNWSKIANHNDLQTLSDAINDIPANLSQQESKIDKAISNGQLVLNSGQITDRKESLDNVLFIGSSTIWYAHLWGVLQNLYSTVANKALEGMGGEIVEQTSARMGARKVKCSIVGGVLPATGEVELVTDLPNYKKTSIKPFTGKLYGIAGEFSYSPTFGDYCFTREYSGDAIPLAGTYEFVPDLAEQYFQGYLVINVGKNNFTNSSDSETYVFNRTVEMINYIQPVFKRALVLGNFIDNHKSATSNEGLRILACNTLLADKYGELYVDVQGYLMSEQVWIDTEISPTADDLTAQSEQRLPASLGRDVQHMSQVTWQALADNVIAPRITSLGWL